MSFKFSKWNGLGNDFVIVNCLEERIADYSKLAVEVCDRHFGVGADGLVLLMASDKADFRMRIFNADGSEAEMCGNVTRCMARYVYEHGLIEGARFTLETGAGIIKPEVILKDGKYEMVRVDMGEPVLAGDLIPVQGFGEKRVVAKKIEALGEAYEMTCVSMGNPHCVIFVDDVAKVDLAKVGPVLEKHALFPRKINVEFVEVKSRSHMRMRVWERGAGITLACGTGASATLVAAVLNDKAERKAKVELDGGTLTIEWAEDGHIYMSGPAEEVFRAEYIK
jgi:diaminopimelate epimerase